MSVTPASGVNRRSGVGLSTDVGEIGSLVQSTPTESISRAQLLPSEEAASLSPLRNPLPSPIAPLTRFLGPLLTVANPAWANDPVPRMRALQKNLVEHSLTLAEEDRSECMAAILVVESAVELRLRYQQMRMNAVEMDVQSESVGTK